MQKKLITSVLFTFIIGFVFSQSMTFQLDGNAHIFSYNNLAKIHQMKKDGEIQRVSAEDLYDFYDEIYKQYGDNSLMKEQKQKETQNTLIVIYGYVNLVRRSILDEYIVELKCNESWVSDLAVVYPSRISEAMKKELMNLNIGDYFEALVVGRSSWYYVDVPVWNSNGTYRTEP